MRTVELVISPPVDDGRSVVWTGRARSEDGYARDVSFWTDSANRHLLTRRGDPFVLAHLLRLMQEGRTLRVRGAPVSSSLLDRLEDFQAAWILWKGLRHVAIDAEEDDSRRSRGGEAITAFSGGVDSSFSLWRHRLDATTGRPRPVTTALFVRGFDIPLASDGFEAARRRIAPVATAAGVRLLTAATDLRVPDEDWEAAHGLGLAATLTLFSGHFATGLIPSTETYARPHLPFGSNAITDPLLGSADFEIVHDGAGVRRLERIRALAAWPQAVAALRPCWKGEDPSRNCGRCGKCLGVRLALLALGQPAPCFDGDLGEPELVERIAATEAVPTRFPFWAEILAECRTAGRGGRWVEALAERLEREERGSR